MCTFRISNYSYHIINSLRNKSETNVTKNFLLNMDKLTYKNKIISSSKFLYQELPIRLSKRIKDLEKLPIDLDKSHEIFKVRDWYVKSLDDITNIKYPNNIEDCESFRDKINIIHDRHSLTLSTMSTGINKLKKKNLITNDIDIFLSNFYSNRAKTRFIIENYLEYFKENPKKIGILYKNCNIKHLVEDTVLDLYSLADIHKCNKPEININIDDTNFIYPSGYLYYSIMELLKNSLVATKEIDNPKIDITCFNDNNLYIIKIKDNGIGIKEENMDNIWKFSFTTTDINYNNNNNYEIDNPLSGFGYGLPISRILLNTFNGDLRIYSEHNNGTETYIIIDINSNWVF
jgi:pyruvate dehydrogenase kinase 2/3/4